MVGNQFAQAACQTVAKSPGTTSSLLFLYGGSAVGKTLLFHAIGHEMARLHRSRQMRYLSSERFTNDLINAICDARIAECRRKYQRIQAELFHTVTDPAPTRLRIAYQVSRPGPLDLVVVPGWVSHLEHQWGEPWGART